MESILNILNEVRPESDFEHSSDFLSDGLLDSFDIVALVSALDQNFNISIDGVDILPEHFQNAETIGWLLKKYGVTP
ncbi:MAG: acyl carrier protein [Verrucomicrobiota bacterium]